MKRLLLPLILVLAALSMVTDGQVTPSDGIGRKHRNCHWKQLDVCMAMIEVLGNRTEASNIIATEEGVQELCSTTLNVTNCLKFYMKKCATPMHRELFALMQEQMVESVKQFCNDGKHKETFLKHSPCINEKVIRSKRYHKVCVNDVMASIYKGQELLNATLDDPNLFNVNTTTAKGVSDTILDLSCCSYIRYEDCTNGYITEECGAEAVEAMNEFTTKTFGATMNMFCPRVAFEPNSTLCMDILPPTGSDPHTVSLLNNPLGKYALGYLNFLFNFDVDTDTTTTMATMAEAKATTVAATTTA